MKTKILAAVLLLLATTTIGQNLLQNPKQNKCYIGSKTPDVWQKETITIKTAPAHTKIIAHPATYRVEKERVLMKEASEEYIAIPAVWQERKVTYTSKERTEKTEAIAPQFYTKNEELELKIASDNWELKEKKSDCKSEDCKYWKYKLNPPKSTSIIIKELRANGTTIREEVPEEQNTYIEKIMISPARIETVYVPEEYTTIEKTVLSTSAWQEEVYVPATYKTITKEVLVRKGGLTNWKEVECEKIDYQITPIYWDLNSTVLKPEAQSTINSKLLSILEDTSVFIEIESHADARGTEKNNLELSKKRAQVVVDYLISIGIQEHQFNSKGLGETQLVNKCSDNTPCSEKEHKANRRSTFRIVNSEMTE